MDTNMQEMINRIESRYNGDFDVNPDGPLVTLAEMQLVQIVRILARQLDEVVQYLERDIRWKNGVVDLTSDAGYTNVPYIIKDSGEVEK